MQRYESYKSSGAAWLGNVPSLWDVQPLRAVTSLKSDKNRPDLPVLSVYREYGVILKDSRDDNHNATSLDTSTYKVVKPGDLVVNKMKAWQGSMGVSAHKGIVSPAYITCGTRVDRVRPAYLHYLLRSSPLIGVYNSLSYGVRVGQWDMHYEDFKQIPIPLPPKEEQDRIVAFLDQKTVEIDAAIEKKERLIDLLQEQKKAAIRRAVTQGIKGSHQLIPHDLSYLKQVPSDWSIKRNKQLFFEKKDVVGKQAPSFTLLSLTLNGIIPRDLDNPKGKFPAEFDTYKKVQPHDMVFCLFDVEETPRTVGLSKHVGMITGAYTVVKCFEPSLAGYLSYFYTALDDEKMLRPFYTGLRNVIQRNTFFGLQVPIPPEAERHEIVEYIDSVIRNTAQLSEKARQEVTCLQELKRTLVAAAVSGKIEV